MIHFGTLEDGQDVHKITLTAGDLTVSLLTWGAIIQDVRLKGIDRSLTLGSENLADYQGDMCHYGALIGPVANRISNARVRLDGLMYELERNQDGRIHLHSGTQATHRQLWTVVETTDSSATLSLRLPDGMCGLPGNRTITSRFDVTPSASLTMAVTGTTDEKTLMNFANHSYWNLDGSPTWDGHRLWVDAEHYLPHDEDYCPTGEVLDVADTDMDFRGPQEIGLKAPIFDHNFCLSRARETARDVLTLTGQSGVCMTMATTEPGIQIYDGRAPARPACALYEGLAIEAQAWPDAPNNTRFPSIVVTPDAPYVQTTNWRFEA